MKEQHQQIQKIRDAIAARAAGKTEAEFERERLEKGVTDAVSRWLADHPNYYEDMTQAPAPAHPPVTDSRQKAGRIMKGLGAVRLVKADGKPVVVEHTADSINPDALALALAKCRELKAADPERYNQDIRYT